MIGSGAACDWRGVWWLHWAEADTVVETSACDRDRDPIFSDLIDYPDHY